MMLTAFLAGKEPIQFPFELRLSSFVKRDQSCEIRLTTCGFSSRYQLQAICHTLFGGSAVYPLRCFCCDCFFRLV